MIWNCVEERVTIERDNGAQYGRMVRKIIFGDIFADKMAVLSRNPIPNAAHRHLNAGDKITYCDSTLEIREGPFICSSQTAQLDAQKIISSLLNTEDDLRQFCLDYKLQIGNFCSMAIEAYKYLCTLQDRKPDNTGHGLPSSDIRKRKLETDKMEFENGKHSRLENPKPNQTDRKLEEDPDSITFTIGNNDEIGNMQNNLQKILPKMTPSSSGTDAMDGTEVIEIPINESEEDTVDFKTEVVENESEQDISGTGTSVMPVNSFNTGTLSSTQVPTDYYIRAAHLGQPDTRGDTYKKRKDCAFQHDRRVQTRFSCLNCKKHVCKAHSRTEPLCFECIPKAKSDVRFVNFDLDLTSGQKIIGFEQK